MTDPPAFLVGVPEPRHPGGDRYLGFASVLGTPIVRSPQAYRYRSGPIGYRVDQCLATLTGQSEYSLGLARMEIAVARHMRRHRGAVYHATRGDLDLWRLPRVAHRVGTFMVASFHDSYIDPTTGRAWPVTPRDRGLGRVISQLHAAVLLGACQREFFDQLLPEERIFVVPHGVDTTYFRPRSPGVSEAAPLAPPVVISVGAFMRDPATLAAAMPRVWVHRPDCRLVVVGASRPGYVRAVPELDDARVEVRDHITDEELRAAYHDATVAVHALDDAVANNALLEQMACGLPIVATDVGAVGEYLGDAGTQVAPRDPAALADALVAYLDDPLARARSGVAARQRSLAFDHVAIAEQVRNVYARVREMN